MIVRLKAVDSYHSLSTAGKWHVNNKTTGHFNVICWNSEKEGCSVNNCHQPKDNYKKKFSEQKQNGGGTIHGTNPQAVMTQALTAKINRLLKEWN